MKRTALALGLALLPAIAFGDKLAISTPTKLALPGGDGGIGFDDLMFAPALHRVLVPAGRTGKLALVDPKTQKVDVAIDGFTSETKFGGGHGAGTTSADAGGGFVF